MIDKKALKQFATAGGPPMKGKKRPMSRKKKRMAIAAVRAGYGR